MKNYVYVSHPDFQQELLKEIQGVKEIHGQLIFSETYYDKICFAQDSWKNCQTKKIQSIGEAVKFLKSQHKYWFCYPLNQVRRSKLIEAQLINPFPKKINFPPQKTFPKTGVFFLLDANTLVYSLERSTNIPFYLLPFEEDRINPPNRAYLKLWEVFTMLGCWPKPDETVLDLGAAPGGWTYVLAKLGSQVFAVDKAPLASSLSQFSNIHFIQQSAFSLNPNDFKQVDWLCADIACYPQHLYELIMRWINAGTVKNFICTIKLQGETDFETVRKFQAIEGAKVVHLMQNKHELTFIKGQC